MTCLASAKLVPRALPSLLVDSYEEGKRPGNEVGLARAGTLQKLEISCAPLQYTYAILAGVVAEFWWFRFRIFSC